MNYSEVSPYLSQNDYHTKIKNNKCGEDVEIKLTYALLVRLKMAITIKENSAEMPSKTKNRCAI